MTMFAERLALFLLAALLAGLLTRMTGIPLIASPLLFGP
jgi:uncharacterized membrane protein AbrB (regulator of aidB expression)